MCVSCITAQMVFLHFKTLSNEGFHSSVSICATALIYAIMWFFLIIPLCFVNSPISNTEDACSSPPGVTVFTSSYQGCVWISVNSESVGWMTVIATLCHLTMNKPISCTSSFCSRSCPQPLCPRGNAEHCFIPCFYSQEYSYSNKTNHHTLFSLPSWLEVLKNRYTLSNYYIKTLLKHAHTLVCPPEM